MNMKSLLLGSAAALSVVSGAHAADAIVAAEPEAMEYVRVCDAFGKGFFYIPGTETCLQIKGYVRTQLVYDGSAAKKRIDNELNAFTRAQLEFNTKNDTEFGTLSSYIVLRGDTDRSTTESGLQTYINAAWINIAGFDVGNYYTWWDEDLSGETDELASHDTTLNGVRYTYDGGAFQAGAAVEELQDADQIDGGFFADGKGNNNIGAGAMVGGTFGAFKIKVIGDYDFNAEEAAFRAILSADVGPGTFELAGAYATDPNYYYNNAQWTIATDYKIKASDKLTITPAFQYFGDVAFQNGIDAWKVGVTAGYQVTTGLRTLATVNYKETDNAPSKWTGFVRLQRDF